MTLESFWRWGKRAFAYFLSTGLVQLMGAATTFIYVRLLPVSEYAVVALAVTTIGFIGVASDLGLGAALQYFRRATLGQQQAFALKAAAVQKLRLTLFWGAAAVGLGSTAYSLATTVPGSVPWWVILPLIGIASWYQVILSLKNTLMRLEQFQNASYLSDVVGAVVRFVFAILSVLLNVRSAPAIVAVFAAASAASLFTANRRAPQRALHDAKASNEDIRHAIRYIAPTIPAVLVFATQDMLILWLASVLGGGAAVAGVFALGRIGALLSVLGGFATVVLVPRLANVVDPRRAFWGGTAFSALLAATCGSLVMLLSLWPASVLWLIGPQYAHLVSELTLALCIASISVVTSSIHQTNRAMGWVRAEPVLALIHLMAIVVLATFADFSSAHGVLLISLRVNCVSLTLVIAISIIGCTGSTLVHFEPDDRHSQNMKGLNDDSSLSI